MRPQTIFVFIALLSLGLMAASLQAQAPELINYQGKLVSGNIPAGDSFPIIFTIYDDSTGGKKLWSEQQQVKAANGIFNVLLGSGTSLAPFASLGNVIKTTGKRFLAIKVGDTPELRRARITSVAYAIRATQADTALSAKDAFYLRENDAPANKQTWGMVINADGKFNLGQAADSPIFGNLLTAPFIINAGAPSGSLAINALGNVGIGTTTPNAALDVVGNAIILTRTGDSPLIRINRNDATGTAGLSLARQGMERWVVRLSDDANNNFEIGDTINTRLSINTSGNVGIGKTPDLQFLLDVNGRVRGSGPYDQSSDLRYKKNLTPISSALDKVTRLRGVSFDWRKEEFPELNFSAGRNLGFIAQEIKDVLPEVVSQDAKGYYSVAYSQVVPVLVEAIKEQQKTIAQQQTELESVKEKLRRLEASVQRLERLTAHENEKMSEDEK